jgi:hypothetical protein
MSLHIKKEDGGIILKDGGIILALLILPAAVLIGPLIMAMFAAFMSSWSIPRP